ncbi:hypothetical protein DV495_001157 [Geotrichum candidum]|nr:hypothetical protein DV495_001157 [Geotrichum candidum]
MASNLLVITGANARNQLPTIHGLCVQAGATNESIAWAYKTINPSVNTKGKKKQADPKSEPTPADPYQEFLTSRNLRYVPYKDSDKILGNTYGMLILQDFEAITPNILARTVETVAGGGVIVILLESLTELSQLADLSMDIHSKFQTEAYPKVIPRFNHRLVPSILSCSTCLVLNDQLQVVSGDISALEPTMMDRYVEPASETITKFAKTKDQETIIQDLLDVLSTGKKTVFAITAGRGRGKSATLGLTISAVLPQYANTFVTSPSPDNLKTFFQFVVKGLLFKGLKEGTDFEVTKASNPLKSVIKVTVFSPHKQVIQFIQPHQANLLGQADLLVIDEAAAIPLTIVKNLLGPYTVLMASTIHGYEGTGRSLSLKLIKELKQKSQSNKKNKNKTPFIPVRELSLSQPIRYASGDPVEAWLNQLLCLDASVSTEENGEKPSFKPEDCTVHLLNKDSLFSFAPKSEEYLQKVMALFVESHYKNSPNDLQLLCDAPAHHLFVLLGPNSEEPLCVAQIALEGGISKATIRNNLSKSQRADGDLIPWLVAQQFQVEDFPTLLGARVVRIATNPNVMSQGYGVHMLKVLAQFYSGALFKQDSSVAGGVVASVILTLIGKQGLSQWTVARVFYFFAGHILGIKVVIKNPEALTTRPAVFVANHQSELDILMLGATFPQYCSVTGKKILKYYPFLGWFMTLSGSVYIDRVNRENALKAFSSAIEQVKSRNQSVFIFPEGTRSYSTTPKLLPFKKGAFHFAQQAQIPIVPWVVSNYSKVFSFKTRTFVPGTIVIEVLEPVSTVGKTAADVSELASVVESRMTEVVAKLGYGDGKSYADKTK